jgi:hypothetical protein
MVGYNPATRGDEPDRLNHVSSFFSITEPAVRALRDPIRVGPPDRFLLYSAAPD